VIWIFLAGRTDGRTAGTLKVIKEVLADLKNQITKKYSTLGEACKNTRISHLADEMVQVSIDNPASAQKCFPQDSVRYKKASQRVTLMAARGERGFDEDTVQSL